MQTAVKKTQTGTARRAAWAVWGAAMLLIVLALYLTRLNRLTPARYFSEFILAGVLGSLAFATVGALIVAGIFFILTVVLHQFVRYTLVTQPGALPLGVPAAWLNTWIWIPGVALFLFFLPLYFPDGRLPSAQWRWAAWMSAATTVLFSLVLAITPGPVDASLLEVSNPYVPPWSAGVLRWLSPLALLSGAASVAAAVGAAAARLRRARGIERQQIKWFAYAVALLAAAMLLPILLYYPDFTQETWLSGLLLAVAIPLLPLAVGFSILRYRLYEIDFLIRRTLLYSLLSAVLALVYFGAVLVFQGLIIALSGTTSDLAVVASTLLIAALFQPLRRAIQQAIDLRFYRGSVDAGRVLASFAGEAQSEVDLERLSGMLLQVVDESMQPDSLSLWMLKK